MPRYLFSATYSSEGAKGLLSQGGTARRAAVEKSVTDLGGRLETFDFAFGSDDVHTIVELPDNAAAAAMALTVSAGGTGAKTTVLLTPEELDMAAGKTVSYAPPGTT